MKQNAWNYYFYLNGNVRTGDIVLIMYFGKSKSAENKAANRVNYMEPDIGVQYKEVVDVTNKVVVMMVKYTDLDITASKVYYVGLDSRTASKVNGVTVLEVYNLVRGTEVGTTGRTIGSRASSRTKTTGW